jgi:L-alanine-DL-glutamate epimerase-like enolase superfamily enzyme
VDEAVAFGRAIEPLGLRWFEEPVDPLDYAGLSEVAHEYSPALATGENLFSTADVTNLALYGGLRQDQDVLQMDPALSYGLPEFQDMMNSLESRSWLRDRLIPHGGHQFNLAIAAAYGLGGVESYPALFEPFGGFADHLAVVDGHVGWPDVPGIGLESKVGLRPLLQELVDDLDLRIR